MRRFGIVSPDRCKWRDQSAPDWELRTATTFADLKLDEGRPDEARKMLAPVYARVTESFNSHGAWAVLLDALNTICPDYCMAGTARCGPLPCDYARLTNLEKIDACARETVA